MAKDLDVTYWIGDLTQPNMRKLIAHCDKKIDRYFAQLNKRIDRTVRAEVKKIMSRKKGQK